LPTEGLRIATGIEQIPVHLMPGGAQLIHVAESEKNAFVALWATPTRL
jgi:hypothetical protein